VLKAEAFKSPDVAVLSEIECRGIIATRVGHADEPYDFVSRAFFPR
jgi:predicted PhzF superfamily epimerase YddE/YHI9